MSARLLGHGIVLVGLLLAGLWLAGGWLVVPWVVAGRSMEPALLHGDRVLVDLWTYRHRPPRIGELVLFEGPEGEIMVKRLAPSPPHAGPGYWLLGDNSGSSRDSRRFGPVPAGRLRGRVVLRYWPLSPDRSRRHRSLLLMIPRWADNRQGLSGFRKSFDSTGDSSPVQGYCGQSDR